jgi:fatty-acid desaturase
MHPRLRSLVIAGGNWLTGLDPKAWVVMHRMHHAHSDTPLDPHSPVNVGIIGVGQEQLRNYKRVIVGLIKNKEEFTRFAKDLDFDLNPLMRKNRWWVPYLMHAAIAVALGFSVGWLLAAAYYFGIMSHPLQGGMVNSLGHAMGSRNFETSDNSRNNHLAAWLIFGEGFQNNHHRYPVSAKFSYRPHEIDMGYGACVLFECLGLVTIDRAHLIPAFGEAPKSMLVRV